MPIYATSMNEQYAFKFSRNNNLSLGDAHSLCCLLIIKWRFPTVHTVWDRLYRLLNPFDAWNSVNPVLYERVLHRSRSILLRGEATHICLAPNGNDFEMGHKCTDAGETEVDTHPCSSQLALILDSIGLVRVEGSFAGNWSDFVGSTSRSSYSKDRCWWSSAEIDGLVERFLGAP